ncbi:MAG: hypothetical protein QNI84_04620 [Henriciella sp.]|nr:hypothetical protein [Henriciella sp.]
MTKIELGFNDICSDTLSGAKSAFKPVLPWLLLSVLVNSFQIGFDAYSPGGSVLTSVGFCVYLLTIFTTGLVYVVAYRHLLVPQVETSFPRAAANHWFATLAVMLVTLIVVFIGALFLIIFSVILITVSGYDPSTVEPSDVDGSISALVESGAIWPLVGLLTLCGVGLGWLAVRLVLYGPATVVQGQVLVFRTWSMTKGNFVPIALSGLVFSVSTFLGLWFLGEWVSYTIGLHSDFAIVLNWGDASERPYSAARYVFGALVVNVFIAPQIWLSACLVAVLYQRLGPVDQATTPASSN